MAQSQAGLPVITTQDLALGYGNHAIVSNITVNIDKGEFIGILGPNGSGKSTFLRALLGLIKPLHGTISILNTKPRNSVTEIGYMPQLRTQTCFANLSSCAMLEATCEGMYYGLPFSSKAKKARIQQVLTMVKASAYADRPFQQLSGGERQRIFLAQALLSNPSILLLDEPLASLDPHYQETFIRLLQDVQQNLKVTILLTAHDPNPLVGVLNRVLFFAQGKAVIGTGDEVITSTTLSALYGTPIEVVRFKQRLFVIGDSQGILVQVPHHHD